MISKTKTITEFTWDILPSPEAVEFLDEVKIPWKDLEFTPPPEERRCANLEEWLREAYTAKSTGEAISCDDPRRRVLGFVDQTRNVWFYISLTAFREHPDLSDEVCGWFGMSQKDIRQIAMISPVGRHRLLGDSTFECSEPPLPDECSEPPLPDGWARPIAELEALWVAEAEQDKMVEFKWPAWERPAPRPVAPAPRPLPEIS